MRRDWNRKTVSPERRSFLSEDHPDWEIVEEDSGGYAIYRKKSRTPHGGAPIFSSFTKATEFIERYDRILKLALGVRDLIDQESPPPPSGVRRRRDRRIARDSSSEIRSLATRLEADPTNTNIADRLHHLLIETFPDYEAKVRAAVKHAERNSELALVLFFPSTLVKEYDDERRALDEAARRGTNEMMRLMPTMRYGQRFLVLTSGKGSSGSVRDRVRKQRAERPGAVVTYVAYPRI